jgi:cell division protein YceG involved in septum cleavage
MEASVNNYLPLLHLVTLNDSRAAKRGLPGHNARRKIKVALERNTGYNTYMNTQTPLQAVVVASLSARERNSLAALQNKVEQQPRDPLATMRVSPAQIRAMQTAYNTAKASGMPLPPELLAAAKSLGLK